MNRDVDDVGVKAWPYKVLRTRSAVATLRFASLMRMSLTLCKLHSEVLVDVGDVPSLLAYLVQKQERDLMRSRAALAADVSWGRRMRG